MCNIDDNLKQNLLQEMEDIDFTKLNEYLYNPHNIELTYHH